MLIRVRLEYQVLFWAQHIIYKPRISWGVKFLAPQALLIQTRFRKCTRDCSSSEEVLHEHLPGNKTRSLLYYSTRKPTLATPRLSLAGQLDRQQDQYFFHGILWLLSTYVSTNFPFHLRTLITTWSTAATQDATPIPNTTTTDNRTHGKSNSVYR